MHYNFDWDPDKARLNAIKHGVTFELATGVFNDPLALTIFDEEHSDKHEERWLTLGEVNRKHYIVVIHTYIEQRDNVVQIRIISARMATKQEIKQYEG